MPSKDEEFSKRQERTATFIDYPGKYGKGAEQIANAPEPVGYVMGLNSVSDYWDTENHEIDDPKREPATSYAENKEKEHDVLINTISDEQLKKNAAEHKEPNPNNLPNSKDYISPVAYHSLRPYQDYACRIQGPALASVHANFELGWCAAEGMTDEHGKIKIKDHKKGTKAYKIKLANLTEFHLDVKDALEPDAEKHEQRINKDERILS